MTSRRRTHWVLPALMLIGAAALARYGIAHVGTGSTALASYPAITLGETPKTLPQESPGAFLAMSPADSHRVLDGGSLRGTEPDGGVDMGFGGHLKPDMPLRRLFDYYLMLLGETDLPCIRTLLHDELVRRRLAPPLIDEAMASFDRYARYQQATVALANRPGASMAQQLADATTLRHRMLGDETAEAFYGDEQRRQQQSLQRLAIPSDTRLSPAEKTQRLQALDAAMPSAEKDALAQISMGGTIQAQTDAFDAAQTDADTRHAERAQRFGEAAADRLQQLDRSRAQWQMRLNAYARQSQAIQSDDTLTASQQQAAMRQLLNDSFHGGEQLQVQAMQRSGLLTASH